MYTYNVRMVELRFEWDSKKEKTNIKKHGVSFEEARTVFFDENAIQFFDPDHSENEDRFIRRIKMKIMNIGGEEDERPLRFFQNERA